MSEAAPIVRPAASVRDRTQVAGRLPTCTDGRKPSGLKISVLLVGHQPAAREGLRGTLRSSRRIAIVGEAAGGEEALALVARLRPAVVLLDLCLPQLDGLRTIVRIKERHPAGAVLVLSDLEDEALVLEAARAGAAGYLLSTATGELIGSAIAAVANGAVLFSASLFRETLGGLSASFLAPVPRSPLPAPGRLLSARERMILELLAEGATNREIAASLALAEVTIKKHIRSIVEKLNAADRTHAAVIALRLGLIS